MHTLSQAGFLRIYICYRDSLPETMIMSLSNLCYCTRGEVFYFLGFLTFSHMILAFAEHLQLETEDSHVPSCSIETVKWNTKQALTCIFEKT